MEEVTKNRFKVVPARSRLTWEANTAYLLEDAWDDWFTYSTMYHLHVCLENGDVSRVGSVKIGQFKMKEDQRRPDLPPEFSELDDRFFSIGQDAEYYECLNGLGDEVRSVVLQSLRDMALDLSLWKKARNEHVTKISLKRSVSNTEIEGQFHRMTQGGAKLTEFKFSFIGPKRDSKGDEALKLDFEVEPESCPPTNVHVVIGRNGVGKTHTMNLMTRALVAKRSMAAQSGRFITTDGSYHSAGAPFSNLVSVCFSAFDSFLLAPDEIDDRRGIEYSYVGLRRVGEDGNKIAASKSPALLATEFVNSATECSFGPRAKRWKRAVETLEADPIFASAEVGSFIKGIKKKERQKEIRKRFKRLSSGHQIVLLSITKLVELVEERSLVLLDEPEGHLHPPLLSAFVRALSDLLIDRNGVAIVATHSPVVLQEVPKNCVWKLQRSGAVALAERPECQTFGENLGVLTREVFRFEVTDSGFHRMLREVFESTPTFEMAVRKFHGHLGAEARAILKVMYLRREAYDEET